MSTKIVLLIGFIVTFCTGTTAATASQEAAYQRVGAEHFSAWNNPLIWKRFKRYFGWKRVDSIASAADRSGRLAGAAVSQAPFQADEDYLNILNKEFNYITPENVAKWGELQPNNSNEWSFEATDAMLESSEQNNQLFKGHALVWHVQLPSFINDDLTANELKVLTDTHITTVLNRYAGRIYSWDVVNEAISDGEEVYRDSVFLSKLGTDFIADAFHTAKAADPFAQLYYNDYGIERINTKSDKVYAVLKELVEAGAPIDGIGFQMHLDANFAPSVDQMVENFERFTALGLTVNVSELDVRTANLPWDKATNLAIQKQVYHRVVDACMRVPDCEGVTTWGFTDKHSWIDSTFAPDDPLQYDESYERKPAYYGMVDGFLGLDSEPLGTLPNLIANSSFEVGTDGWFASGGGTLKTIRSQRVHGRYRQTGSRSLLIKNRTETFHGPAYDLLSVLRPNQTYDVSSLVSIRGTRRGAISASVQLQCVGEESQFVQAGTVTAKKWRWRDLEGEFTTPDCELEVANLYFESPITRAKLILDNPAVRARELVVAPNPNLGPNVLTNGGFESGTDTWFGFDTATVETSDQEPFAGLAAGFATNRVAEFDGFATSLLGLVVPGEQYQLTSRTKVSGVNQAQVKATLRADCPTGPQFLGIAGAVANEQTWSLLTGTIQIPNCEASDLVLYFEGPDAAVDLRLDEVYLQQDLTEPSSNIIGNSDFEGNADGWFAFGSAFLSTTSEFAYQGSQSLLATNRTQNFEGPAIGLGNVLIPGEAYSFTGFTRIRNAASAEVRATLQLKCASDVAEQYLGVASTTANELDWSELAGSVVIPACEIEYANLFVEGPDSGIDIAIDALTMEVDSGGNPPVGGNLVGNSGFEEGATAPWFGFGGALIEVTTAQAFAGQFSLIATNRTQSFEGPAVDLVGVVTGGETYSVGAQVRVSGSNSAPVSATVQTVCADGSEEFSGTASVTATDSQWTALSGEITLPSCDATAQRLYFQGADAGVDILIDEVQVSLVVASSNLVLNGDFENGTDNWFGFGGAVLATVDQDPHEGLLSLIATNRTAGFEGPATDLIGRVDPASTYSISAQLKVSGIDMADVSATIQTVCEDGTEQFNGTGSVSASNSNWIALSGDITLPDCAATAQRLYFQGPDGGIDILLDSVEVVLAQ